MKSATILILCILLTLIVSCDRKQKAIFTKDIFFGLSIGMDTVEAKSIIKEMIKRGELDNYGAHYTQKRENQDAEILINLFKPFFGTDKINELTYWIQVSTTSKEFSDKFHKGLLDQLKEAYGNANEVQFEGEQSVLKWNLEGLFKIELTIDPEIEEGVEMYSIKYYK